MPSVQRSDAIFDGQQQTIPQVQYASVSFSASADLVALVASLRIRVLGLFLVASAAATLQLQSGGTANLSGVMSLIAGTPLVLPVNQFGWFQTASGAKLNAVMVGTAQISGAVLYVAV